MKERLSLAAVVFAAFACGSFVARAEIVFAKGVTLESGWYDVNKAYVPANIVIDATGTHYTPAVKDAETFYPNSDYDLCWAATASNMLQWWQDRIGPEYVPAGTPNGTWDSHYADRGQLEIYKTFCENWTDAPGVIETGLAWWLDGSYFHENYATELVAAGASFVKEDAVSSGGYFAEMLDSANVFINSWYFPKTATTASVGAEFSSFFENDFLIGLSMSSGEGIGHAITCWGVETNAAGGVTLYYTDSDDCTTNLEGVAASEGGGEELKSMSVTVTDGVVNLGYSQTKQWTLNGFTSLAAPVIVVPEPSAFGLFAGAGALVFAALRRRRRRAVRSS